MHVIAKAKFDEATKNFPNDVRAIDDLYRLLKKGDFKTPEELIKAVPSLDNFKYLDKWYVIDINGSNLRLLAFIEFTNQKVFVRHILNHKQYDKFVDAHRKGKK